MKKIIFLGIILLTVCGCATLPSTPSCPTELQVPDYFAGNIQRVAFELQARAHGYQFDGILQIKKLTETSYEATLFSMVGGVQILRAQVKDGKVSYPFVMKTVNRSMIRNAMKRLLLALLTAPHGPANCKQKDSGWQVRYSDAPHLIYEYTQRQIYPQQVRYRKIWGSSLLHFTALSFSKEQALAQHLSYEDGSLQAQLWLMQK